MHSSTSGGSRSTYCTSVFVHRFFDTQWDASTSLAGRVWRSMVKHQPLQVYERQLCLSCLTGIYGCRWKRYQRSHDDSSKVASTFITLHSRVSSIIISHADLIWSASDMRTNTEYLWWCKLKICFRPNPRFWIVFLNQGNSPDCFFICVWRSRETQAEVSGSCEGHAVGHSCLYTARTGSVGFSTIQVQAP